MGILADLRGLFAEGGLVVITSPVAEGTDNGRIIRTFIQYDADVVTQLPPSLYEHPDFEQFWQTHMQEVSKRIDGIRKTRLLLRKGWLLSALPLTIWSFNSALERAFQNLETLLFSAIIFLFMRFGVPVILRQIIQRHMKRFLSGQFTPPNYGKDEATISTGSN